MERKKDAACLLVLAVGLLVGIGGCAVRLTTAGAMVREVSEPTLLERCEFLGVVEANSNTAVMVAAGLQGFSGNTDGIDRRGMPGPKIIRKLRNKIGELGGNVFLLASGDRFEAEAEAYRCADEVTTVRELRQAAEAGDADAQYNLGVRYVNGEGTPQDFGEAYRWYQLAAEQGHAMAQAALGGMYFLGRGILKDDLEAVRWFRRAAEQGTEVAQGFLGRMYASGEGVLRDLVLAHMWYNIAGANGLDVEITFEATERLEAMMSRADINRAMELARRCMESDYQDCGL